MSGEPTNNPVVDIGRRRITSRDGWWEAVRAPQSVAPKRMTRARFDRLSADQRISYGRWRRSHHMNLPVIKTAAFSDALENILPLLEGNALVSRRTAKQGVAISGMPHLGKTMLVESIGRIFELNRRAEHGWDVRTSAGGLYVPVVMIDLAEKTRPADFDKKLLRFLHAPIGARATHNDFAEAAIDHLIACGTQVVVVDDIHELKMSQENGQQVNAKIKGIADATGVTFIVAGVDLPKAQFLTEGKGEARHAAAQTRRRFTLFNLEPHDIKTDPGRADWLALLAAVDNELVLVNQTPGVLTDHWELVFARTQGYIGTVVGLAQAVANAAIIGGTERITERALATARVPVASQIDSDAATRRVATKRPRRTA